MKQQVKYKDKPSHPNIHNPMVGEMVKSYDKMLFRMSKQFGQKLASILK